MLLGIWKSYQELEENICLAELEAILEAARKRDYDDKKFAASLKGIDLDSTGEETTGKDIVDDIKTRIAARQAGVSPEAIELADFGIDVETV